VRINCGAAVEQSAPEDAAKQAPAGSDLGVEMSNMNAANKTKQAQRAKQAELQQGQKNLSAQMRAESGAKKTNNSAAADSKGQKINTGQGKAKNGKQGKANKLSKSKPAGN
jgi:hypothetical protein